MKEVVELFKLLSDESRLRILMLLCKKELSVCQIMGVLDVSQPLISRNLSLLTKGGLLNARREGKLVFYRVKKEITKGNHLILSVLKKLLQNDATILRDLKTLKECEAFQKKMGRCDMETLKTFIEHKRKKMRRGK